MVNQKSTESENAFNVASSQKIMSDVVTWMKYARFRKDLNRRESWKELVERNKNMHINKFPDLKEEIEKLYEEFVLTKKVLPSMRSMQFAGKAIDANPARMYNCCFLPINSITSFSEAMFLLLGGTGVGYSVRFKDVSQINPIAQPEPQNYHRFVIADHIEGWADAIKYLLKCYTGYHNHAPIFDFSQIRPQGAELVTSGGRAPGPAPLKKCLDNIQNLLQDIPSGFHLTPLQCHDIMCFIADAVRAGGIRRAAMISLFDPEDTAMARCKSTLSVERYFTVDREKKIYDVRVRGHLRRCQLNDYSVGKLLNSLEIDWWDFAPERGRANNSVVLNRKRATYEQFFEIWKTVQNSGSGEPGIFWTNDEKWGTNPCAEIALQPFQFCNLVEINASNIIDQKDLEARSHAAAFIGTLQASYTDFHYLRPIWRKTTEEEALLGVSFTGIASGRLNGLDLEKAAEAANMANIHVSTKIGIKAASRVTCVKPAGTTSLVLGCSSGVHAWHDEYFIRRVRVGKDGGDKALYEFLKKELPDFIEDCNFNPDKVSIFSMPMAAPNEALTRSKEDEIDLLERIKSIHKFWIKPGHFSGLNEHNVSATVSIKPDNWTKVGDWMWKNKEHYNGISVLPYDGGTYQQAPFESVDETIYNKLISKINKIDFDITRLVESEDNTTLGETVACAGGACEL